MTGITRYPTSNTKFPTFPVYFQKAGIKAF